MKKSEFIKQLAAQCSMSQHQAAQAVDTALGIVSETLNAGQDFVVQDFGKLTLQTQKAHNGRNPRTGEPITIPERKVVRFRPFSGLLSFAHKHQ